MKKINIGEIIIHIVSAALLTIPNTVSIVCEKTENVIMKTTYFQFRKTEGLLALITLLLIITHLILCVICAFAKTNRNNEGFKLAMSIASFFCFGFGNSLNYYNALETFGYDGLEYDAEYGSAFYIALLLLVSLIIFDIIDLKNRKKQKANIEVCHNIKQEIPQSNADELKKYKDLLDSGIITQEEFDAKKKQLLGL